MSNAPTTVLFDLDGTLCRYDRGSDEVLAATFEQLGLDRPFEMAEFHERYVEFLPDAADAEDLYERCFTALACDAGFEPDLGREITSTFLAERDVTAVDPCQGATDVVAALRDDCSLGLVTNGHPDLQRRKLAAIGLEDAFETEVFAGYDTPAKPSPEPFTRALAALDASPESAVYVGNSPTHDVVGARKAGLAAALVTNGRDVGDHEPDYAFASLHDILEDPW